MEPGGTNTTTPTSTQGGRHEACLYHGHSESLSRISQSRFRPRDKFENAGLQGCHDSPLQQGGHRGPECETPFKMFKTSRLSFCEDNEVAKIAGAHPTTTTTVAVQNLRRLPYKTCRVLRGCHAKSRDNHTQNCKVGKHVLLYRNSTISCRGI